ncbi:MAG: nicotinamide-nucleotide adenylyltransferase [Desulfurococcaceae archaeon]|nr:nicotinamide-nucleotide adenylyltransferase [Sulfolobales archaeon]MDW8169576.1 nicotinamide-nucleotide adenylyltransferase [Desulfurococcaceae archaeon]
MKRALFIGRFQPFHKGHLYSVNYILKEFEEVVIVVAAAQYSYTLDNPFTAGERIEMIKAGLSDLYDRAYVIPIDNTLSNYEWPRHVLNYTPRVSVVFSNNKLVQILFKTYGLETRGTPVLSGVSGSLVRKLMAEGGEWEVLVPEPTANLIKEFNGVERMKTLWAMRVKMSGERFDE